MKRRRPPDRVVSEGFLNAILNGMLEGLVVGDKDGRIRLVNPRALQLLGGLERDWLGRPVEDVLPGAAPRVAPRRPQPGREGVLRALDGREVPVIFGLAPIDGRERGFVATFIGISARKEAERGLAVKARELERSNRELEQFAYVASHDLQEPLRKISNFTELLARRYRGKLDADADQFVAYIIDGTHRMRALIQGLLEFSRVGRQAAFSGRLEMKEVVQAAVSNIGRAIVDADARIEVGPLPAVRGDAQRLAQLFQNLIANAVKFRHADRRLLVKVGGREERGQWVFWVEDNGIGIEPRYREQVFAIFQRLHTIRAYPGTGIGLAICRRIAELHGGRIWIEPPAEGDGSRFVFSISKRASAQGEVKDEGKIQGADGRRR